MKKRLSLVAVFSFLAVVLAACSAKYTIEFVEKNGTEIFEAIEVREGKEIVLPENPTKDGLTFDGWYTDPGFDEEFTYTVMPAESFILYAKWVATLTFDSNGGSECNPITNKPLDYAQLPEPTKDGYVFAGWYTDNGTFQNAQKNAVPAKHTTVYAKWQVKNENTYYPFNNWRDNDGSAYTIEKSAEGTKITANENKGEWSFAYDLINIDGTGFRVVALTLVGTKDCEAVIKLEGGDASAVETRVKFTGEEQVITWVVKETQISTVPGQKLMIFLNAGNKGHVKTAATDTAAEVKFEQAPYVLVKSAALYQPQDIGVTSDVYAIHFDSNGGETVPSIYAKAGTDVTTATPKKDGHVFVGWYTDAEFNNKFDGKAPAKSTLLFAKWQESVEMIKDTYSTNDKVQVLKDEADRVILHSYANGVLTVKKTAKGGDWTCIASKEMGNVLEGATKATVVLTGPAGKKILVKINDQYETWVECTGAEQTVEIDLTGKTFAADKTALLLFPEAGNAAEGAEFAIKSITFNTETPVELASKEFVCNENYNEFAAISATYNKGTLTLSKLEGVGEWVCVGSKLTGKDILGSGMLVLTIKGPKDAQILVKINNRFEKWVTCTGEVQTEVIDFSHIELGKKDAALYLFPEGGKFGTGAQFEITSLYFLREVDAVNPTFGFNNVEELVAEAKPEEEIAVDFAVAEGVLTIAKTVNGGEWTTIESNLKGDVLTGATKLTVVLTGTEGKQILAKVNDRYETWITCTGAEQTVEIDLTGKEFDAAKTALYFFPEGSKYTEGAEFAISKLEVTKGEEKVDLIAGGFTCHDNYTYWYAAWGYYNVDEDKVYVRKYATAGEWVCISTKAKGSDIAAYSYVELTIKGPEGKQILVKMNDQNAGETWVTCTGEEQLVKINYSHLTINKSKPAIVFFPEGGAVGTGEYFEISSMVFSKYTPVDDALVSKNALNDTFVCNDATATTATVKADGSVAIAKTATEGFEWTYVKSTATGAALEGYNQVTATISGKKGEKILVKVNDKVESMVEIAETNVPQTVVINIDGLEINKNAPAILFFPGAGTAGATGEFVISQLVYSTYKLSTSLLGDTLVCNDANATTATVKENGSVAIARTATEGFEWTFVKTTATGAVLDGYTKVIVTVAGKKGEKILVKVNDKVESMVEIAADNVSQTVVINIEDLDINANAPAILFFPGAGTAGATGEFVISQIELSNVNNPLNVLTDTYTPLDADTYTITPAEGKLTVKKTGTGEWQFAKGALTGKDIVGYTKLTATVTGKAGQKITFKINDQFESAVEFTADGTQTVEIAFPDLVINEGAPALLFFINGGVASASEDFVITQLVFGN